jgi:hypothetical protein
VSKNSQVVIATHSPIVTHKDVIVDNAKDFYDVIADYPNAVTVGGHTHTQENLIAGGEAQGMGRRRDREAAEHADRRRRRLR